VHGAPVVEDDENGNGGNGTSSETSPDTVSGPIEGGGRCRNAEAEAEARGVHVPFLVTNLVTCMVAFENASTDVQ
jgi:hypothetical protein